MQEPRGHSYWKSSGRSFTNFHWRWHVYTISHRSSIILLLRLHKIHRTDPLIEFGMILNLKNVESDWLNGSLAKELNTENFQHLQSILAHENAGFREWGLKRRERWFEGRPFRWDRCIVCPKSFQFLFWYALEIQLPNIGESSSVLGELGKSEGKWRGAGHSVRQVWLDNWECSSLRLIVHISWRVQRKPLPKVRW